MADENEKSVSGDSLAMTESLPSVLVPHPHVTVDPLVMGGSPLVRGTRVPVRRLWAWHQRGLPVATIVARYSMLGPARVLDALSFAYDNKDLIEADLARERGLLGPPTLAQEWEGPEQLPLVRK
jgi:uncharacterized protein (DUF433 family)